MSNHSGGYMLNEILKMLEEKSVFEALGEQKTRELILNTVKISRDYDCNSGEILDEIGERMGLCYCCLESATEFRSGAM
jgi:hypothetical protein